MFAASGAQLARSFVRTQEDFPFVHETAFGHVALRSQGEATGVDHMRQLLNATPDRGLFIYPGWAAAYLWVGGRNPTPYDLILPQYQNNDERQGVIDALARQDLQGLIDTLERRRPRYIVITFVLKGDPVVAYVEQHYHTVDGLYVRNEE